MLLCRLRNALVARVCLQFARFLRCQQPPLEGPRAAPKASNLSPEPRPREPVRVGVRGTRQASRGSSGFYRLGCGASGRPGKSCARITPATGEVSALVSARSSSSSGDRGLRPAACWSSAARTASGLRSWRWSGKSSGWIASTPSGSHVWRPQPREELRERERLRDEVVSARVRLVHEHLRDVVVRNLRALVDEFDISDVRGRKHPHVGVLADERECVDPSDW